MGLMNLRIFPKKFGIHVYANARVIRIYRPQMYPSVGFKKAKTGKKGTLFFSRRHRHDENCHVVPPEDRPTRMLMWSPVMFPRGTQTEVLRAQVAGVPYVDVGPWLAILRQPIASENLRYVTTWDEWNEEAERRGYDAELQTGPNGAEYAHVRSKPGTWKVRRKEYEDHLRVTGVSRRVLLKMARPKVRGRH